MVKVKDLPVFEAAEYLHTLEMQADYLLAALEEGTPDQIRKAIKTVARARGMVDTEGRRHHPRRAEQGVGR